jgi:quinone-modifying oxidoreductase, subunit QmoB
MLCGAEGVKLIQDDIDAGNATHIMIAACSRRSKVEAFSFPTVAMSRANLREGVIWARPEGTSTRRPPRRWRTTMSAWPAPRSSS